MKNEPQEQTKKESDRANTRREVKEVATKLRHLSPVAKAEVVNEVIGRQVTKQVGGFTDFLRNQGVIGVGIGLVLGIQIKAVVDTVMASFVNPVTQLLLPGKEALSKKTLGLNFHGESVQVGWGAIVYSLFTFLMVALIIYIAYRALKLDKLTKKKD
jgi:large conductance mechanosensitive channel